MRKRRLALVILGIIADATMRPGRGSYLADWNIAEAMRSIGYDIVSFGSSIPPTEYDEALQSLVEDGSVEELSDLPHRYQLKMKERQQITIG